MDFEITTNLDTIRNQAISANFAAVDAWLTEELKPYNSMAVTEDMIPTAKTYRANLRKVKDRIEAFRKEAKNAALAPYNKFEADCKILTGKIDAAVENIDSQVKEHERREAEAKLAEIKAVYDSDEREEARAYCPWERILNPKWANKGYNIDDAKEEVAAALFYTANDLESIRDMGGDNTPYLLDVYKTTHDLNTVIRKSIEIQAAKEREGRLKQEEAERRETLRREAEERRAADEEKPKIEPQITSASATTGNLVTVDFRVVCTNEQLANLGKYMRDNGIKYGRVP